MVAPTKYTQETVAEGVPVYPDPCPSENPGTYMPPPNTATPLLFTSYRDAARYQRRMARRYGVVPAITPVYTSTGTPMYSTGGVSTPGIVVVERQSRGLIGKAFCVLGLAFALTGLF